ncbi:hypothetical protein [Pedobacter cryoconitis]|uniref:Uncharacterized protein n=1 Tax=Pedobacter cryoconitis TaxID=188932 RepID=A0A7X0J7B0_9SPHI|nr:hypothetical protein [Pedobacter cryoconitis]MBB6501162.1 hypothetical protein [Pedobacter cryoconitis]
MYLKKMHILLTSIIVFSLSCKSDKKTVQDTKRRSVRDTTVIKDHVKSTDKPIISVIDTNAVLAVFKRTAKTERFIKELGVKGNGGPDASVFDSERPILIGDLNGDHLEDALMPFSIEGRGGGNNWDAHYAVFINKGGKLEYQYSFSRGGDLGETQVDFINIKDGIIHGMEVPGIHSSEVDSTSVNYIYRKTDLSVLLAASDKKNKD